MDRPSLGKVAFAVLGGIVFVALVFKLIDVLRSDEARVRKAMADVVEYTRKRDPPGVLLYIDPEYRDVRGHTYGDLKRGINVLLRTATSAEAEAELISIEIEGDTAIVRARVSVSIKCRGETFTLRTAGFKGDLFEAELVRFENIFRVRRVRYVKEDVKGKEGAEQ